MQPSWWNPQSLENHEPAGDIEALDSSPGCLWGWMDGFLTILWMFILVVAIFLWVVVVVPPQYFVFLKEIEREGLYVWSFRSLPPLT